MKYVIDLNRKFDGCIFTCMSDDVHSDYGRETLAEMQARNPECELQLISETELDNLIDNYLKEATSAPFAEITKAHYWDLMECVPPARWGTDWFFVGEPFHFDIHLFCFKINDRYFCGRRRLSMSKNSLLSEINNFAESL